jgi:hypothetical protein
VRLLDVLAPLESDDTDPFRHAHDVGLVGDAHSVRPKDSSCQRHLLSEAPPVAIRVGQTLGSDAVEAPRHFLAASAQLLFGHVLP